MGAGQRRRLGRVSARLQPIRGREACCRTATPLEPLSLTLRSLCLSRSARAARAGGARHLEERADEGRVELHEPARLEHRTRVPPHVRHAYVLRTMPGRHARRRGAAAGRGRGGCASCQSKRALRAAVAGARPKAYDAATNAAARAGERRSPRNSSRCFRAASYPTRASCAPPAPARASTDGARGYFGVALRCVRWQSSPQPQ